MNLAPYSMAIIRHVITKSGDKLEVIVSHCDPVVNLYDQMYAIRGDKVEAVWPISARGMSA
jgi:D-serine deaminase-like pyridoxal phosphate-dependent protein